MPLLIAFAAALVALVASLRHYVAWWGPADRPIEPEEADRILRRIGLPLGDHAPPAELLRSLLEGDDGGPLLLPAPPLPPGPATRRAGLRHGCAVLPFRLGVRCRSRRDLVAWCFDPSVPDEGRAWIGRLLFATPSPSERVDAWAGFALGTLLSVTISLGATLLATTIDGFLDRRGA